jgi:hypothetical protein
MLTSSLLLFVKLYCIIELQNMFLLNGLRYDFHSFKIVCFLAYLRQRVRFFFFHWSLLAVSVSHKCMFHIFDIFFRTTACPVITRATHFPIEVLKQCCIFSEWLEIQDGHYGLWFADTFFFTTCRTTAYELKVVRLVRYVPLELVLKTC